MTFVMKTNANVYVSSTDKGRTHVLHTSLPPAHMYK